MKTFKLPDLGEGLPDAIIREWHVKVGDEIKLDQPMVAMETAKALVDVPAPFTGVVEKLFGSEGDTVDTGQPLIGFNGEADLDENLDAGTVVGSIESSSDTIFDDTVAVATAPSTVTTSVKATPAVRMLAKQLGVDLNTVKAAGAHLTADDVKRAANVGSKASTTKLKGEVTKLSGVRRAMVLSMTQSHQQVVPASIMGEADLHAWDKSQDVTIRILRALQAACKEEPILNCYYDSDQMAYQTNDKINIGIAVDTKHGLFVPVLKDVANRDDNSLREDINRFKQHAQDRSFPAEDLRNATIIMSNVGAIAGNYAAPVVIPPMVAITAFGRAKDTVVPVNDKMEVHRILPISITFDHRPVTGGDAARFLKVLIDTLEKA